MAAYQSEVWVKMNLINSVDEIADKLKLTIEFGDPEHMAYGDLLKLRDDLQNQYNNQFFESNSKKELGIK